MKPPRIVHLTDPRERQVLLFDLGKPDTPAVYHNLKDDSYWAEESELYKWRERRKPSRP